MTPFWLALVLAVGTLPGLFLIALLVVGGRSDAEDLRQMRLGPGEVGRMLGPASPQEEGAKGTGRARGQPKGESSGYPTAGHGRDWAAQAEAGSVIDPLERLGDRRFSP